MAAEGLRRARGGEESVRDGGAVGGVVVLWKRSRAPIAAPSTQSAHLQAVCMAGKLGRRQGVLGGVVRAAAGGASRPAPCCVEHTRTG